MFYSNLTSKAISPFNVGLALSFNDQSKINIFLLEVLQRFTEDLNLDQSKLQEVKFEHLFTDKEFNNRKPDENEESFVNKYLYPIIFSDINKGQFNTIDFKIRYAFTFDKSITDKDTITKSGIKYGQIFLGKKPIMYYIYIDVQEIINIIKS
jgi:hypothetical protein